MKTHSLDLDEHPPAEALIHRVLQDEPGRFCITSSFQAEDMVVLHLVRRWLPNIAVLFLDTGYHFRETYAYRDRMSADWNLNLVNLLPITTVAEQERARGLLYLVDPTQCCHARKVAPLMRALEGFEIWFTGLRREQSPTRANLKKIEKHRLPSGKEILKVSPIADWNWREVLSYMEEHTIPKLPMYEQGYRSIGCEPCTSLPTNPEDPRSGRWSGKKLECGIHTVTRQGQ
ncbi:MAG TPA: phosphoadenylyl-sulfate reductase [Candidatus Angelobacter sp.]|jgi:phosphoadenosine phosphosulfate reductase|nr:phosphoadenylyl-sulfate reductase [Candidatus Angelobacter sp.]